MDPQLLSIHYSDPLWIAIAFACGLGVKAVGMPPLVGFLGAGFVLNLFGARGGEFLSAVADLGITLLLFSIGLKLRLRSLAEPVVWGVGIAHMGLTTLLIAAVAGLLAATGLPLLAGLDLPTALLIGFALSFSSTVFAVKVLDELGATNAMHGRVAIGVLVIQDIAAVVFMAISLGKLPSVWTIALLALIPARHLLFRVLERVGHGELLILFGFTLALVGAAVFELVGIKEDVGALVFGMLLANHPKANELAKALLGFKELFLVGFFLSVGMTALPSWSEVLVALLFILVLPVKVALYFGLFSRFRLRASTSWRTSLNLANYSEFGLIIGAMAATSGALPDAWLAVFAVVVSLSFMLCAPLMSVRDALYLRWRPLLKRFEHAERLPGEENLDLAHVKVVVFGMGRMGTAAYDAIQDSYPDALAGVEIDAGKVTRHTSEGRQVVNGDATNPDFWTRAPALLDGLEWVLLALPAHTANLNAARRLRDMGYAGRIAATTKYRDEEEALKALGVDHTFNIYTEAGLGFANELQGCLARPADHA
ncbi:cation:proton antiporter family protein [Nitrogeniibacter aestuarii]|uniref:cation:proton antiporter family protein n=1 Tax=Nitrogeniibacter aestuarii TaxID=2815343 RepID=UPI001E301526|nr:cation:proton antiporter family protein [Nitrogeniibacter aestuarii]